MTFDGKYQDWNQKRIKGILEFYGHKFLYYKKILDLGCGHADISGVFYRLGADVTAVDARQEHLKIVNKKYNGIKTIKADLDSEWPFARNYFDIVLDLDLLCHLNNYEDHLRKVCSITNHLILETAVCDSDDPNKVILLPENKSIYDASINGVGSRPTAAAIERILTECGMNFRRQDKNRYNSNSYVYDWENKNDDECDINKRRLWFAVKNTSNIQFALSTNPTIKINESQFGAPLQNSNLPLQRTPRISSSSSSSSSIQSPINNFITNPSNHSPKIRLFYNYYVDENPQRRKEIDFCLKQNINNPLIDIIVLESEINPTFDFFIEKINLLSGENDINIICNSDIFLDNTIQLVKNINKKEFYALSRYDWNNNSSSFFDMANSQDTWIFRGKVDNVNANFQLGKLGCDNRIAHEFKMAGYTVTNPSKSIKTYHVHNSNIRRYTENERINGTYLFIKPTSL
jgi:SAM-dependent methyltransferase